MNQANKVKRIVQLLEMHFGEPVWRGREDPLESLILTILSQNTNDRNRDMAYQSLIKHFPNYEALMVADPREIAKAIRSAGLSNQKSQRIKQILEWIHQTYGSLDLRFLCDMHPDEAIRTFMALKGIGIKTISVVLMFSCGVDIFPVDTHVHRICGRIGLVPGNTTAEKTHHLMQPLIPKGKSYSLHMNFLRLGRTICKARNPNCSECPIRRPCDYGQIQRENSKP